MNYNPGKWHKGPDAVSRKPSPLLAISLNNTEIDDTDCFEPSEERILSTGIANLHTASMNLVSLDDKTVDGIWYYYQLNLVSSHADQSVRLSEKQ